MKKKMRETGTQALKKKMTMSRYLSVIILNVNGLNTLIKRHRVAEWIFKNDLHICCLQETHLRTKDLYRRV